VQRIRSIKPAFFMSETVGAVSFGARLLFIGLWTLADREGRLVWKPKEVRAQVFPHDVDLQLAPLAEELVCERHIRFYQDDEHTYVCIPEFKKHQRPHVKEPASTLPPWPEGDDRGWLPWRPSGPTTPRRDAPGPAPAETGEFPSRTAGREGKGREQIQEQEPASRPEAAAPRGPRPYDRRHSTHAFGFCDWACLPEFLVAEFANLARWDDARVVAWAEGVRASWPLDKPIGDNLRFWRARWAETHRDGPQATRDAEAEALHAAQARRIAETAARNALLDTPPGGTH
jgi:hypothetical protein